MRPAPTARATRLDPARGRPVIDGDLQEPAWRGVERFGGFRERKPRLGAEPPEETRFSILYDDEALYFAVTCADSQPAAIRALTLQRDSFAIFLDDAVSIKLDAQGDRRTTLGFVLNPAGGMLDYRGINESEFRAEFDSIWQGATRRGPAGWTAEVRIPWASLGISPDRAPPRLGLNLSRDHSRRNATYDWALMAPPLSPVAASRYGHLLGLDAGQQRGRRGGALSWALIPYVLAGYRQEPGVDPVLGNGGFDARLEQGERLSLQLSVNTDFAQVDLDDQRINLGRFGLFFPEKRDFFLRDLEFFRFGQAEEAEMLQTRRIGLRAGQAVPLLDAMKLLLRPLPWLRVGLLQALTLPGAGGQPWTLSLVGRVQAELGKGGSNVGLMVAERQSLRDSADHNLVLGVDGAYRGKGPLLITAFSLMSLTGAGAGPAGEATGGDGRGGERGASQLAPGGSVDVRWRGLLLRPGLRYSYYHPDLRTDLGFFRRVGVHDARAVFGVEPRLQRRGLERLSAAAYGSLVADASGAGAGILDWGAGAYAELFWNIGFSLGAEAQHDEETVQRTFQAAGADIAAGRYGMNRFDLFAGTPAVWRMSASLGLTYRDYYGGDLEALSLELQARPFSLLRIEGGAELSRIDLDGDRGVRYTAAVNGRLALGFTPRLGFDAFVAWNSVADLIRLQGRLRYRYSEGSDIFVVLQEDLGGDGTSRFLSLLCKVSLRLPEGIVRDRGR